MDLEGLEKVIGKTFEQIATSAERIEAVGINFNKQARRLYLLAKTTEDRTLARRSINIADLTDTPFGAGRLSAITNSKMSLDRYEHELTVGYFFTPKSYELKIFPGGNNVSLTTERFTNKTADGELWPQGLYLHTPDEQIAWTEDFIAPQIPVMDATATMLEEALQTDGLGNEATFARYNEATFARYKELLMDPIR